VGSTSDGEHPTHHELDPEQDQERQVDLPEMVDQMSVQIVASEIVDCEQRFDLFVEDCESVAQQFRSTGPETLSDLVQNPWVSEAGGGVSGFDRHGFFDGVEIAGLTGSFERILDEQSQGQRAELLRRFGQGGGIRIELQQALGAVRSLDEALGERVRFDSQHRVPNPGDQREISEKGGTEPQIGKIEEDEAEIDDDHPHHEEIPQRAGGDLAVFSFPFPEAEHR
jgi:hypothetical protein